MLLSRRSRIFAGLLGIGLLGFGLFGILFTNSSDSDLRGVAADPPRNVSEARLPDASGRPTGFAAPKGGLTLAFFGYTRCPDVCPTTMSDLRTALGEIDPKKADDVKVAMVSIDPAHDSAGVLQNYVGQFFDVQKGIALRTDDQIALKNVTNAFGVGYSVTPNASGGDPSVSHTSTIFAVDDTGHIRNQWSFGTPPKDIQHDLEILLA